jgi:Uma2 family endonuclease
MNIALREPRMTREEFFDWAEAQEERYEFDDFQPVAMAGGSINHSQMISNLNLALRTRLRGNLCRALPPDAGVATIGDTVRYPDALITCTKARGTDRLVPGVVVVFEVLGPTSGRTDWIDKLGEYRAVASIRRYVILEYRSMALTVFARDDGEQDWTARALTADDILSIPEVGIELPVADLYEGVDLQTANS